MPFKTGRQKTGGRAPGIPNKTSIAAKQAFELAFNGMGSVEALAKWGKKNPGEFYRIYGRLIPTDTKITRVIRSVEDLTDDELVALAASCTADGEQE